MFYKTSTKDRIPSIAIPAATTKSIKSGMSQTILFCCLLAAFAITSTEAAQALNAGSTVTFSDRAVGAKTSVSVSFSLGTILTHASGAEAVEITFPLGFVAVAADLTVDVVKECGSHTFGTITVSGQAVTLPLSGSTDIEANRKCTFRINGIVNPPTPLAANNVGYEIAIVDTDTSPAALASTAIYAAAAGDSIQSIGGAPTVYSVQKTCKSGGEAGGATATSGGSECIQESSLCYDCSKDGYSFYTEYVTSCTATSAAVRCDARMYSKSTLDIYFNTNGIEGTTTCGAFTKGTTVGAIVNLASDSSAALISKSSADITSKSATTDNVISLTSLKPKTPYDVYCQTNDNVKSTVVTVWTAPYPIITGYSYLRSTTTALAITGTAILKFTHGHELVSGDVIVVSLFSKADGTTATGASYYSGNPACTATSGAGSTPAGLAVTSPTHSSGELTITLGASSDAGNEIVVTCNTFLVNPANGFNTVYNLNVEGHNLIKGATGQSFAT